MIASLSFFSFFFILQQQQQLLQFSVLTDMHVCVSGGRGGSDTNASRPLGEAEEELKDEAAQASCPPPLVRLNGLSENAANDAASESLQPRLPPPPKAGRKRPLQLTSPHS